MTLADLRRHIAATLGTDPTAGSAEETLIDDYCNEAVRKILLATHCQVLPATATPGAVSDWPLPTPVIALIDMYFASGGADYPSLQAASVDDILRLRRVAGTSVSSRYALAGANLVMFWPAPGATDLLTYYYVPQPTPMTVGAHDPSNATYGGVPVEWHDLIEWYGLFRMGDYDDDGSSRNGVNYKSLYDEGIVKMRKALRRRGGQSIGPAQVNRRRRGVYSRSDTTGV